MKIVKTLVIVIALGAIILPAQLKACSSIYFNYKDFIGARTLDFLYGDGNITIYPKKMSKESYTFKKDQKPYKWTSKYGSVSFDINVDSTPLNNPDYKGCIYGMNETGLTAGVYAIFGSKFPAKNTKPVMDALSFAQYILDEYKDVNALEKDLHDNADFRVVPIGENNVQEVPLHYLVHDSKGNSLVIEFVDGKLCTYKNPEIHALTNTPFANDEKTAKEYTGFGGEKKISSGNGSTEALIRGAYYTKNLIAACKADENLQPQTDMELASFGFDLIQTLIQPLGSCGKIGNYYNFTQYTIVTNITKKIIYYRTYKNAKISYLKLSDVDFNSMKSSESYSFFNDTNSSGNIINKFKSDEI